MKVDYKFYGTSPSSILLFIEWEYVKGDPSSETLDEMFFTKDKNESLWSGERIGPSVIEGPRRRGRINDGQELDLKRSRPQALETLELQTQCLKTLSLKILLHFISIFHFSFKHISENFNFYVPLVWDYKLDWF